MRITSLDYSSFQGASPWAVTRGSIAPNQPITLVKNDGSMKKGQVKEPWCSRAWQGKVKHAVACGEVVAILGLEGFDIGDTVADAEAPEGLPIRVDEPTMSMLFTINTSHVLRQGGS